MSWVLEVIEKAALERARQSLGEPTVFGLSLAQVAALVRYFEERIGSRPHSYSADEILRLLREAK